MNRISFGGQLEKVAHSILDDLGNQIPEMNILVKAEEQLFNIRQSTWKSMIQDMRKIMPEIVSGINKGTIADGHLVGITSIDKFLVGIKRGFVYLLGSRPGMGKTSFAMSIIQNLAVKMDLPVGFITLEQSVSEAALRFLCMESGINPRLLLNKEEFGKLTSASTIYSESPIYLEDDPNQTITKVKTIATKLKQKHKIELLVLDYLQLIRATENNMVTQNEMAKICQGIKQLAKVLDIPILVLTQLSVSVEKREDKIPQLSDLRFAGVVEENADVIMFLYRPGVYFPEEFEASEARLIVAKNRQGPTGVLHLKFNPKKLTFESV